MDLEIFHVRLLGTTLEHFRPTPRHRALYTEHARSGVRGFASDKNQPDLLLATLVLALMLTQGERPVVIIVPRSKFAWVTAQIKEVARHVFRLRKKDLAGVAVMRKAFQCLQFAQRPLQLTEEPSDWVVFGFGENDALPSWARDHLVTPPPEVSV